MKDADYFQSMMAMADSNRMASMVKAEPQIAPKIYDSTEPHFVLGYLRRHVRKFVVFHIFQTAFVINLQANFLALGTASSPDSSVDWQTLLSFCVGLVSALHHLAKE